MNTKIKPAPKKRPRRKTSNPSAKHIAQSIDAEIKRLKIVSDALKGKK